MNLDSDNCVDAARARPYMAWIPIKVLCAMHIFVHSSQAWFKLEAHARHLSLECAKSLVMWYPPDSLRPQVLIPPMPACITVHHDEPDALHRQLCVGLGPPSRHMNLTTHAPTCALLSLN
jgi:hypothetical protein